MDQENFQYFDSGLYRHFFGLPTVPRKVDAFACGKAILVGEHAVVYGAKAVAMPLLTQKMQFSLRPICDRSSRESIFLLGGKPVSGRMLRVLESAFKLLEIPPYRAVFEGISKVPIGAGLGSSASLCVGLVRSIARSVSCELSLEKLAYLSNELEKHFHGRPSGLDTAVVAYEKIISFVKGHTPSPIQLECNGKQKVWRFALIDSAVRASTMTMIKIAEPYFRSSRGDRRIQRFQDLAEAAIKTLESGGDQKVLAQVLETAGKLLEKAGVVTNELREIMASARELGVLAAKPTGAGGGGCVLALLPSEGPQRTLDTLRRNFGSSRVYEFAIS